MNELKTVRRESGRSKIIGFKSQRYFLKAVFSIIWTQDRVISTEFDRLVCLPTTHAFVVFI